MMGTASKVQYRKVSAVSSFISSGSACDCQMQGGGQEERIPHGNPISCFVDAGCI